MLVSVHFNFVGDPIQTVYFSPKSPLFMFYFKNYYVFHQKNELKYPRQKLYIAYLLKM